MLKKLFLFLFALVLMAGAAAYLGYRSIQESLPKIISMKDYDPLLVTQVFDRNNKKIGEFFRQRRILVPYEKIPKNLVNAFLAAEDDQFFHHGGINFQAILRATFANIKAGRSVQGGSTITQQVAKTFFLTHEKTLLRKLREAMLAFQIEDNLKKEEILYLYLNQIYFGQGAYGVEAAAQVYFRKSVGDLKLAEMAILGGLPQAPTTYTPVRNPLRAKERQTYVLRRMAEVGFISKQESEEAIKETVSVYITENYDEYAPFYLETIRQMLNKQLGESMVLDKGLYIYTGLDLEKQKAAQDSIVSGLKGLDKRQGFRGPLQNIMDKDEQDKYLVDLKKKLITSSTPQRKILPDGKFADIFPKDIKQEGNVPFFAKLGGTIEGIVEKVDDLSGLVFVKIPDSQGIISMDSMTWARKPDATKPSEHDQIRKPSQALKEGDVILVRIIAEKFEVAEKKAPPPKKKGKPEPPPPAPSQEFAKYLRLNLDQEPLVEGSLISFDQETQDVLAMVGGYKFERKSNEFNRAVQAARQTGSVFKAIVYASALDKNYTPATTIMDVPIVFEEKVQASDDKDSKGKKGKAVGAKKGKNKFQDNSAEPEALAGADEGQEEGQEATKVWKPSNHSKSFNGDIIFRNALVKSLNSPTVKIMQDLGVNWVEDYSRRFGIFSKLNPDFTLALGSSSVTLYEMTKVFSQFGRLGKRIRPRVIVSVKDHQGKEIQGSMTLDDRFQKEMGEIDQQFEQRRTDFKAITDPVKITESKKPDKHFFFEDPDQLIDPKTAYVMTTLLKGVIEDPNGTGGRAHSLGREAAAKTGTTNGYYDAWFIGYTPQIATGVWVGFDREQSIGLGEVGGRAALPSWLEYMKKSHEKLSEMTFPIPEGIIFVNIDSDTGKLASARSKRVIKQAFIDGTEPKSSESSGNDEGNNFYKQDLNE